MLLIASVVLLYFTGKDGSVSLSTNVIFVVIFFVYMIFNVINAKKAVNEAKAVSEQTEKKDLTKHFILFVAGAAMIVFGSNFMVNYGGKIAEYFGVPERIIAVTLVAIGTSLPELVTTISAIIKKEPSLSIGNIIGANILNITMVMPVASFVSGSNLFINEAAASFDLPFMVGLTLLSLLPIMIKERSYKVQGVAMLAAYVGYLIMVL